MAQVTKVRLVDDLDGGEADESISFTVDGKALEIDLSNENADKLRDIFAPYIAAAHVGLVQGESSGPCLCARTVASGGRGGSAAGGDGCSRRGPRDVIASHYRLRAFRLRGCCRW